ncbi:MAG: Ig-like domain-containing protein [Thermoplasmatota archaeon]
MNAYRNKNSSMVAILMAFMLISAVFLGLAILPGIYATPGDIDDPFTDDSILEGAGIDTAMAYTTSDVTIAINYSLKAEVADFYPVKLTVTVTDGVSVWGLYGWNEGDGTIVNPYNWDMNLTTPDAYTITVRAVYYYTVDTNYWFDEIDLGFTLVEGTGMVDEVILASKDSVINDGTDSIDIYFNVYRASSEISDIQFNIFNEWLILAGGDGYVFSPNLTAADLTITPVGNHCNVSYTWDVPMGMLAGYISADYDVAVKVTDYWGYSEEVYQNDLFKVVWMELPPYMTDGEIEFAEDSFTVVDLNDHFEDINGDDIVYYSVNLSAADHLTIVWLNEHTLNITAEENWNGVEEVPILFTDGINENQTDNLTITVTPLEDPLMEAEDTTILVDEHIAEAIFDARVFFYDPDADVTDNLTISLGWDWALNETNVSYKEPVWTLEEENFTVMINSTDQANSKAMLTADLEEGRWDFQVSAWFDGEFAMNGTAYVEIIPVNDVPTLSEDTITVYKNTPLTVDLSEYFVDADGPALNLTVNETVSGALLNYDWETYMLSINPATNWTGTIDVEINATDGMDFEVYTITIEVILMSFTITGTLAFEAVEGVDVNMSMVVLTIGGNEIDFDLTTGAFSIILEEGTYGVVLAIPEEYLYDEDAEMSGYEMPELNDIELSSDLTYDIAVMYKVYESPIPTATWDDIDLESMTIKDVDKNIEITVGVMNDTYLGYVDIPLQFVIKGNDDETFTFNLTWNPTDKIYTLELTEDDLKDVPEGKREYYLTDGTHTSATYKYEFKEKDENANLITVIVLIVLIVLVLIALVFIMRKPSEEEFDEEEEEAEEEGERTCPSCGETVTDEEADLCPYCGEGLEEE